jgi:hypothetical protein
MALAMAATRDGDGDIGESTIELELVPIHGFIALPLTCFITAFHVI